MFISDLVLEQMGQRHLLQEPLSMTLKVALVPLRNTMRSTKWKRNLACQEDYGECRGLISLEHYLKASCVNGADTNLTGTEIRLYNNNLRSRRVNIKSPWIWD